MWKVAVNSVKKEIRRKSSITVNMLNMEINKLNKEKAIEKARKIKNKLLRSLIPKRGLRRDANQRPRVLDE